MKKRNLAFIVLASAVLMSVLLSIGMTMLPIGVSSPDRSLLEGRKYQSLPAKDIDSKLLSGEYQKAFEQFIADKVPCRDEVLLKNAAMQKACITLANAPYGFYAYHTFYGSDHIYIPSQNAVLQPAKHYSSKSLKRISAMLEGIANVAESYPDKRFVVYFCASYPVVGLRDDYYDLVSGSVRPDDLLQIISEVPVPENVEVLTDIGEYASDSEFFSSYYRTDHHWNALGFTSAYNDIADELGLVHVNLQNQVDIPEGTFSGSYARSGRDAVTEDVFDIVHDYSSVTFLEKPKKTQVDGNDHHYFYENLDAARWNFYRYYYTAADEYDGQGSGRALLLTDSFGMGIARPLAQNYKKLYRFLDFYHDTKEGSLVARLEEYDPDDVFIIASNNNYFSQLKRIPGYFDI